MELEYIILNEHLPLTDRDTHSQTMNGAWGLLWKNRRKDFGPQGE
ncbi:hypothetical protein T06_15966 [Trichinella sp. T6]|nr:hypothetical protein T06_15966 [Trichinella sp. T6]